MITVEQYLPYGDTFGRVTAEEELAAEHEALDRLVDDFAAEMKAKLKAKADQGWRGWDDPKYRDLIVGRVIDHFNRAQEDPRQYIDVANLAAMLWNLGQEDGS